MARGQRWIAIGIGLLLLLGEPALQGLVQAATVNLAALPGASDLGADIERERRISRLLTHNPRLGAMTSERILTAVERCGTEQGLPSDLVLAVLLIESDARPGVRSPKGAIGLMQVMPHMFQALALPGEFPHIEANIEAGCMLLADNIRRFGEEDGISAYFWGSRIRDDGYLRRVQAMRRDLLDIPHVSSAPERG